MPDQNKTPETPQDYRADVVGVLHALFKRKRLIISGIIIVTILAVALSMVLSKVYRSDGFFQFSDPSKEKHNPLFNVASQMLDSSKMMILEQLKDLGMLAMLNALNIELVEPENFHVVTFQQFKKYSSAFSNHEEFLNYVQQNKLLSDEEFEDLQGLTGTAGQFKKLTQEKYALSRDDLKNVGLTLQKEKNYVLGADLEMEASDPKKAQKFLAIMGEFIRFCIVTSKINEYTTVNLSESKIMATRYDSYIISNRTALKQLALKRKKLQDLNRKYASISKDNRQLVQLGDTGQRFLSIGAQLVGVETRMVDMERLEAGMELEKQKNLLYSQFFTELKKRLDKKPGNGKMLFKQLAELNTSFFKGKDQTDPVIRSVFNTLSIDMDRFFTLFEKTILFTSGPSLPNRAEWPRKSIFAIFGLFMGALFFIILALVLEFWERHKTFILAK